MSAGSLKLGWARAMTSRFLWSVLVPTGASLVVFRYLLPPPMEGPSGGVVALIGRIGDQHPLAVLVGLFLAISATASYWRGRLRGGAEPLPGARLDWRSSSRLALSLAFAVVAALVVRSSIAETYQVVSGSMIPTFMVGDRLLVDKRAYGVKLPFTSHRFGASLPRRGDVVLVDARTALAQENLPTEMLVKRVIGLPGDRISFERDRLAINSWVVPLCDAGPFAVPTGKQALRGRLVVEYLDDRAYLGLRPVGSAPVPTFTVPPGQVFLVGDDRVDSNDSRTWNGGRGAGVPVSAIQGRVTRILGGARRPDGTPDLSRFALPLRPELRLPGVDLATTNSWIEECLQKRPPAAKPPVPKT